MVCVLWKVWLFSGLGFGFGLSFRWKACGVDSVVGLAVFMFFVVRGADAVASRVMLEVWFLAVFAVVFRWSGERAPDVEGALWPGLWLIVMAFVSFCPG
jgi:hypothetical protein